MLTKAITYTDYDGETRTENFYFNLTKAELLEMQLSIEGGLQGHLERIIKTQSQPELIKMFKDIIMRAYGEKSLDGKRFMKSDEIRQNFECTEAYSELFMELATDSDAAAEFINEICTIDVTNKDALRQSPALNILGGNAESGWRNRAPENRESGRKLLFYRKIAETYFSAM